MLVRVILVLLSRRDKHFKLGRAFIGKLWSEISNFPSPDYWIHSPEKRDHFQTKNPAIGRRFAGPIKTSVL